MTSKPDSRRRDDYGLLDKLWLLDYSTRYQTANAGDLAKALADHLNEGRGADKPPAPPPGTSTVNDWKRGAVKL